MFSARIARSFFIRLLPHPMAGLGLGKTTAIVVREGEPSRGLQCKSLPGSAITTFGPRRTGSTIVLGPMAEMVSPVLGGSHIRRETSLADCCLIRLKSLGIRFSRRGRAIRLHRIPASPICVESKIQSRNQMQPDAHLSSILRIVCRATVRPLVCAMRTASRWNPSLCIAAISGLLDGEYCSHKAGTKPGQVQSDRSLDQRDTLGRGIDALGSITKFRG